MSAMTYEQALPLIEQGFHFNATEAGLVQFTPEQEAEWAAWRAAQAPTLSQLKEAKIAALRALRRSKTLFMTYTFGGVTYTDVPADYALSAVTGTILAAQLSAPDEPFWWELKPGVNIQWYVADAEAYGIAIRAHIQACFDNCVDLGTAINAAADQAALDAIDITTGWPA